MIPDRFVVRQRLGYMSPAGSGYHYFRLLVEVTERGETHTRWRTVEVLAEAGRPALGAREPAKKGQFRNDVWPTLLEAGLVAHA